MAQQDDGGFSGFWLFDGLEEEPYGLLPLVNLAGKGGPTSTKSVERIGSYQWRLEEDEPVILVSEARKRMKHRIIPYK